MDTEETTDLIVHPNPTSDESRSNTVVTSVFGRFLSSLMVLFASSQRLSISVQLVGFPVLEAVSAGLAILCQKLSEKLGLPLGTESQWENMAARVDRLVSIGMEAKYETPEKAAEAFVAAVVNSVIKGQNVPREPKGLYAFFFQMSTNFFAQCIAAASQLRREIEAAEKEFEEGNMFQGFALVHVEFQEIFGKYIDELDPATDPSLVKGVVFATLRNRLEQKRWMIELQKALRELPLRLSHVPNEEFGEDLGSSVSKMWINTQLMLSAINAPSSALILNGDDYPNAVRSCRQLELGIIIQRFFERMKEQGFRSLPADLHEVLLSHLTASLSEICGWSDRAAQMSNWEFFVDMMNLQMSHLSHDEALSLLVGEHYDTSGDVVENVSDDLPDDLILRSVDWGRVTVSDCEAMLDSNNRNLGLLTDGIIRMNQPVREAAGWAFLRMSEFREKEPLEWNRQAKKLVGNGVFPITVDLVGELGDLVSDELLKSNLEALLQEIAFGRTSNNNDILCGKRLLNFVKELMVYFETPAGRWLFMKSIMDCVLNAGGSGAKGVILREKLPAELWEKLCLAELVLTCAPVPLDGGNTYGEFDERIAYKYMARWETLFDENGYLGWEAFSGFSMEEGAELVKRYSEEEIFRWLYEFRASEIDELWAMYSHARDQFYSFWESHPEVDPE